MSAARALPEPQRRGWCPSLARPMPTGDGLLARVHPPLGILTPNQLAAIAEGARRFGNGHVDVTSRANLQIRGVTSGSAAGLAALLSAAGLGDRRADGGPQRLTLTSPLAGLDGDGAVLALAGAIEAAGRGIARLPAKTLVALLGPGVDGDGADLRVWVGRDEVCIALSGEDGAIAVDPAGAAEAVARVLTAFAGTGCRRMRDLSDDERVRAAASTRSLPPVSSDAREIGEAQVPSPGRERERVRETPSLAQARPSPQPSPLRERGPVEPGISHSALASEIVAVIVVEAPFGRCAAEALDRLVEVAGLLEATEIRTTPTRGFLLAAKTAERCDRALEALASAGFVTSPADPRRALVACPGAPACGAGSTPVPEDAARLAKAFAGFAKRGLHAHVSGCAKGCAHPGPADLTLVGREGRYGVVLSDAASAEPACILPFEDLLERVSRADPSRPLAQAFVP